MVYILFYVHYHGPARVHVYTRREFKQANDKLLTNLFHKSSSKHHSITTAEVYFKSVYRPHWCKVHCLQMNAINSNHIFFFFHGNMFFVKLFMTQCILVWFLLLFFLARQRKKMYKCKLSSLRYGWLNCHKISNIIQ